MPNNIIPLEEDIKRRAQEEAELAQEDFSKNEELTPEEQEKLEDMKAEVHTVVVETDPSGNRSQTPVETYAEPLDDRVVEISDMVNEAKKFKTVNQGDIRRTVDEIKESSRQQAIRAFRELSVKTDAECDDESIMQINNAGLDAVKEFLKVDRLEAGMVTKRLGKLNLRQIVSFLPKEFIDIYVRPNEITANNIKAKERLLTAIAYLTITGPEMDYLNEYIDGENRLMEVSKRLMECQVNFLNVLKSEDKMSEIAREADKLSPQDNTIWSKAINVDPKVAHNDLTQKAVISQEYKKAYEELLKDYEHLEESEQLSGDALIKENALREKARAIIMAEIEECDAKYDVYTSVFNLDLMRDLWETLTTRYRAEKKTSWKYLQKEAVSAMDRIRRAKQNVPFPVYDEKLAKRPEALYKLYITEFSKILMNYNTVVHNVSKKNPEETKQTGIILITIDGVLNDTVREFVSMFLLILYGRIMKKLSGDDITKYDAITLDAYFQCYCRIGTDIYLTTDIWNMMKDFIGYAIERWADA